MGGRSSKQSSTSNSNSGNKKKQRDMNKIVITPPSVQESIAVVAQESPKLSAQYSNISDNDEFYDGIPRYRRSLTLKSRSYRGTKVSEVGSILGRAGSAGLGRAVDVLDALGTSVTSLNLKGGGFVSGSTTKNSELTILAFEVANTIVKASNLMESLSMRSIRQLKEVVLPAKYVQLLISNDTDELLSIVASDKREELKVFAGEVVRFGNRCKDPQWHNLDRFFEKRSRDRTPQKQLKETAEAVMLQLMTSVQLTAELYQELHALDRSEQDYQRKRLEEFKSNASQRGDRDNSVNVLLGEIKSQRKVVKNLKKKSLWSRSMEEVMGKLVDIVLFLNQEINNTFGTPVTPRGGGETPEKRISNQQKLGPAGLALHYANIILQIDAIVARPSSVSPESRDTLYQSLPPNVRDSLRSKLQTFHVGKELTVTQIKDEMEKTLHWLALVATNTAKAHHGFGWVGEWANTGSAHNHRTVGPIDIMQIETLHHADKQKTEAYVIDLLSWLNYLVNRSKPVAKKGGAVKPSPKTSGISNREFVHDLNVEKNKLGEDEMEVQSSADNNTFDHLALGSCDKSLDVIDRV
ncbi:hypothetical protein ABFS83_08G083200 [Erythranthe nasuta]